MEYPLKQIGCNKCGRLTEVLDIDARIPKGWVMISQHTHYCPECAKIIDVEQEMHERYDR